MPQTLPEEVRQATAPVKIKMEDFNQHVNETMLNISFEREKAYLEKANAMYELLYGKSAT